MRKTIFILSLLWTIGAIAQSNESNIITISAHKVPYFSDFAKSYVEQEINAWQVKDEFRKDGRLAETCQ